ncbi:aminotransferase class IV [Corynebacterium sp. H128]|uniref:aminotransferase class IV n=1 Tax=Corynebacterium sp. H128 TaxID=3133427 RepID=UPI00309C7546
MRVTSFRMISGHVRGLSYHFERLGLDEEHVEQVRRQLRQAGAAACFPLVSAAGDVTLRPDRRVPMTVTIDPIPHLDERSDPTVKGPDLDWLAQCQQLSKRRGYDEGLLADARGTIVEGVFSALLVFEENSAVFSSHPRALPSTTARLAQEFFRECGIPMQHRLLELADLEKGCWLLNAFSGARTTRGHDRLAQEFNSWAWRHAERV